MKTFKTITFVTATTAVVSAITLFSVEQTKVEEKFFEDSLNPRLQEQKNSSSEENNHKGTYAINSADSIKILTNSKPLNPDPDILKDTIEDEEIISK